MFALFLGRYYTLRAHDTHTHVVRPTGHKNAQEREKYTMETMLDTRTLTLAEEEIEDSSLPEEDEVFHDSAYYATECGRTLFELNKIEGDSGSVWSADRSKYPDLLESAKALANEYNQASRMRALCVCSESEDPMFEACKTFKYDTISVKDSQANYGAGVVHHIEHKPGWKEIDLLALRRMCGAIGKNPDWYYACQKLAILYTLRVMTERGASDEDIKRYNDSFFMTKKVKEFRLAKADENGRTPNPVSKKQMVNTLNRVIEMMVGPEYHCDSRDVMDLEDLFISVDRSEPLKRKTMRVNQLIGEIHTIVYRVISGGQYTWKIKEPRAKKA